MKTALKKSFLCLFLISVWFHGVSGPANADLIFTSQLQADFEVEVVDGPFSALDGINIGDILQFRAVGSLEFRLDDSVPGGTSMPFTDVIGTLTGGSPGPFLPFEMTPDVEFVGGSLDNIVRDGRGQITAANVVDLQMSWEIFSTSAMFGGEELLLYSSDPLDFTGHISTLPFSIGDQLFGSSEFELYIDAGLGNPGLLDGDPLAAIGRTRILMAVPEPSSISLLTLATGIVVCRRRRKP